LTIAVHEAEVASRFDALVGRFRTEVDDGDVRLAAVRRALAGLDRPGVLDLGCGKGRFARHLAGDGASVIGVDLSSRMLADAEGLDRARATALRLPFRDRTFDAVVAIEAFEHLGAVGPAIAEARRVLRPGGRLVVVDKNARSLDPRRPWLPGLAVKWIDERRGLWMYPAGGPVRERWFVPGRLRRDLGRHFERVTIGYPLGPDESRYAVFRMLPATRRLVCWVAVAAGGRS